MGLCLTSTHGRSFLGYFALKWIRIYQFIQTDLSGTDKAQDITPGQRFTKICTEKANQKC